MKLYHDDCLNVMPTIASGSVDAIIADLPYGNGITACEWDSVIPLDALWIQFKRVIKSKGAIVLFGSQPFTSQLIMSNIKMYKYSWYWKKERGTGFQFAKSQPLRLIEDICIFASGATTYNPQMIPLDRFYRHALPVIQGGTLNKGFKTINEPGNERLYKEYTHSYPHNLLSFCRNNASLHPTQKPVDLLTYLVLTYTNKGETVLDCTMGSGTTGEAAILSGRDFIGIEKDLKYFEIAKQRIGDAALCVQGSPKQITGKESDYQGLPLMEMQS